MSLVSVMSLNHAQRIDGAEAWGHGGTDLFECAPPNRLQRRLGLTSPGFLNVSLRAQLAVAIGWAPIIILALVQDLAGSAGAFGSVLSDISVHGRYLIAAPLLILAEAECAVRLNGIIHHFHDAGIVPKHQRRRFDAAIASTRRLLQSRAIEIGVFLLAYLAAGVAIYLRPHQAMPAWQTSSSLSSSYSPAGWWHLLISLPLLLVLLFGWMWRLILWARLLWLFARFELRLVPAHPDHAGGLAFLGHSLRPFSIVALAITTIAAARSAELVRQGSALPTQHLAFNVSLMAMLFLVFASLLLIFTPALVKTQWRGALEYGALAGFVGQEFERKWLRADRNDRDILEKPDFSATTDLYSIASNAYAIRLVPVELRELIVLAIGLALPFVPVMLMTIPPDVIWSGIKGLLH